MNKIKVLIAEDDKSLQALYDASLPDERFEKRIVGNGLEAVREYAAWQPHIIILDILMPRMLGYSVLKEVREIFSDYSTTIIMATSVDAEEDMAFCQKEGIQGYIVKPFNPKTLADLVLDCHQKSRDEKERE